MDPIALSRVVACTEARPVGGVYLPSALLLGISTDSRTLRADELYIALKGANFDGHAFLEAAVMKGAGALCGSDVQQMERVCALFPDRTFTALLVEDSLTAYQQIAAWYRTTLRARVIAITGSVGKTSTRDMVSAALAVDRKVHRTAANLNNEIGLPRTLLEAEYSHDACVVEMGMRARGEIGQLSRIAKPDAAIVTNIGTAHIEYLGSREAILEAKMEIVEGLVEGGTLFLNLDDPYLRHYAFSIPDSRILPATGRRVSLVGITTEGGYEGPLPPACVASLRACRIRVDRSGTSFDVERSDGWKTERQEDVKIPVPGRHAVLNALFGLAAADWEHVPRSAAAAGVAAFEPTGSRMRILDLGGVTVIDDCYNASPESMTAAFASQKALAAGRRMVAALGGMNELGSYAEEAHRRMGVAAAESGIGLVFVTGPHSLAFAEGSRSVAGAPTIVHCLPDVLSLTEGMLARLQDGDVLLIKGSRSFGMEKVLQALAIAIGDKKEDA